MKASNFALYKRLLGYTRPYARPLVLALLALIAAGAIEGSFPKYLQLTLEWLFESKRTDAPAVAFVALGIVVIFAGSGLFGFLGAYGVQWVGNKIILDLRREMFDKFLTTPTRYFDENTSGALISKVANDVLGVQNAATSVLVSLVRDSAKLIFLLAILLTLNWRLTLFTFLVVPILAVVIRLFSVRLRRISHAAQVANAGVLDVLKEAIANHRIIRIFGGAAHERQRFVEAANRIRSVNMKHSAAAAAMTPFTQTVVALAIAAIIYFAVTRGEMTQVSDFVTFVVAVAALIDPIKKITSINEHTQRGLAAAESVFAVLDAHDEPDRGTTPLARAKGAITFDNISLAYPGKPMPALRNIMLAVAPGEMLALVGGSGGGKTSLVNLIPRFYEPSSGRILMDGTDIAEIRLADLRTNIALVSQDVRLFNDTVAGNIAYGTAHAASREAITAAARAAHALDFIEALPQGFDTPIGEDGGRLSGGQRQRLAIARAFLKDAPILLLDEATSALDSESERHVQAALEELMRGRTTLIIAHRLSTIEKADRIVVLAEGEIVELGTHATLLAKGGTYAALYRLQFGGTSA